MTFAELQNIFQTPRLPWEHDYYVAKFENTITPQEFLDHAYKEIADLSGIWYEVRDSVAYFLVKKGTVIPDDFAVLVTPVTEVPTQPVEGTE